MVPPWCLITCHNSVDRHCIVAISELRQTHWSSSLLSLSSWRDSNVSLSTIKRNAASRSWSWIVAGFPNARSSKLFFFILTAAFFLCMCAWGGLLIERQVRFLSRCAHSRWRQLGHNYCSVKRGVTFVDIHPARAYVWPYGKRKEAGEAVALSLILSFWRLACWDLF